MGVRLKCFASASFARKLQVIGEKMIPFLLRRNDKTGQLLCPECRTANNKIVEVVEVFEKDGRHMQIRFRCEKKHPWMFEYKSEAGAVVLSVSTATVIKK
jgi:hypothetical protein